MICNQMNRLCIILFFCVSGHEALAQGMSVFFHYCNGEPLGCGCDPDTRVPFGEDVSWCVFWDRTGNGSDASDEPVVIGTGYGEGQNVCQTFNGVRKCGSPGHFASDSAFSISLPVVPPDQPVYFIKATGPNCCWVSDTIRILNGLSDYELLDGMFSCSDTPCPFTIVPAEEPTEIIREFALSQNFPNPFNGTTTINLDLSRSSQVSVTIYDVLGRQVGSIIDHAQLSSGTHSLTWGPEGNASGTYLIRLQTPESSQTIRAVFQK